MGEVDEAPGIHGRAPRRRLGPAPALRCGRTCSQQRQQQRSRPSAAIGRCAGHSQGAAGTWKSCGGCSRSCWLLAYLALGENVCQKAARHRNISARRGRVLIGGATSGGEPPHTKALVVLLRKPMRPRTESGIARSSVRPRTCSSLCSPRCEQSCCSQTPCWQGAPPRARLTPRSVRPSLLRVSCIAEPHFEGLANSPVCHRLRRSSRPRPAARLHVSREPEPFGRPYACLNFDSTPGRVSAGGWQGPRPGTRPRYAAQLRGPRQDTCRWANIQALGLLLRSLHCKFAMMGTESFEVMHDGHEGHAN